jgi:hypothetical protein
MTGLGIEKEATKNRLTCQWMPMYIPANCNAIDICAKNVEVNLKVR